MEDKFFASVLRPPRGKKLLVKMSPWSVDAEGPALSRAVVLKLFGPRHLDEYFSPSMAPQNDILN